MAGNKQFDPNAFIKNAEVIDKKYSGIKLEQKQPSTTFAPDVSGAKPTLEGVKVEEKAPNRNVNFRSGMAGVPLEKPKDLETGILDLATPIIAYGELPGIDQAASGTRAFIRTLDAMSKEGVNAALKYDNFYKEERGKQDEFLRYLNKEGALDRARYGTMLEGGYAAYKGIRGLKGKLYKGLIPDPEASLVKSLRKLGSTEKEAREFLKDPDNMKTTFKAEGGVLSEKILKGKKGLIQRIQRNLTAWKRKNDRMFGKLYDGVDANHAEDVIPTKKLGEDISKFMDDNQASYDTYIKTFLYSDDVAKAEKIADLGSDTKKVLKKGIKGIEDSEVVSTGKKAGVKLQKGQLTGKSASNLKEVLEAIEKGEDIPYKKYREIQKRVNEASNWGKQGDLTKGEQAARDLADVVRGALDDVGGFEDLADVNKQYKNMKELTDLVGTYMGTKAWMFGKGKVAQRTLKGKVESVLGKIFAESKVETTEDFLGDIDKMSPVARAAMAELITKIAGEAHLSGKSAKAIMIRMMGDPTQGPKATFSIGNIGEHYRKFIFGVVKRHKDALDSGDYLKMFDTPMEAAEFSKRVLGRAIRGAYQVGREELSNYKSKVEARPGSF